MKMRQYYFLDTIAIICRASFACVLGKSELSFFTHFIFEVVKRIIKKAESKPVDWLRFQDRMLGFVYSNSKLIHSTSYKISDVTVYTFSPKENARLNNLIVYFHGGGFVLHSKNIYREFCQRLALKTELNLIFLDYQLAPEAQYPKIHNDCLNALVAIIEQNPDASLQLVGDSAGANILIYCYQHLNKKHKASISSVALISPWLEIGVKPEACLKASQNDYLTYAILKKWQESYCDENQCCELNTLINNIDLTNSPRFFLQYSCAETLSSQAECFIDRVRQHGINIQISQHPALFHIFQIIAMDAPEASNALNELCYFLVSDTTV